WTSCARTRTRAATSSSSCRRLPRSTRSTVSPTRSDDCSEAEPPMRIVTVGGGPAGLYFSLLMKKADPAHDLTVLERNPPDATFGWRVVFSAESLGALRDAARHTYEE